MPRRVEEPPGDAGVERSSPLCHRYHGFVLGQSLALAFMPAGRARFTERAAGMRECLADLGLAAHAALLPETAPDPGGSSHAALLTRLLPYVAARSRELAEFVVLGGLLIHYGLAVAEDPATAATILTEIDRLRAVYDLPPLDPGRLAIAVGQDDADVVGPSLAYLREILLRLPTELDAALCLIPSLTGVTDAYERFARPALEHCGYRAFRPWARFTPEDDAAIGLALIDRSGFVWADVSDAEPALFHAVGAAHALGKRTALVTRADRAAAAPSTLGGDAVIRYDPADADWPASAVPLMAACLAALELAADRGERLRVTPGPIARVFDEVSHALRHVLLPAAIEAAEAAIADAADRPAFRAPVKARAAVRSANAAASCTRRQATARARDERRRRPRSGWLCCHRTPSHRRSVVERRLRHGPLTQGRADAVSEESCEEESGSDEAHGREHGARRPSIREGCAPQGGGTQSGEEGEEREEGAGRSRALRIQSRRTSW